VETTTYFIEDLCCADEENLIRKKLGGFPGVRELKFNLISRKLIVTHSCTKDAIAGALREIGFAPKFQFELDSPGTFWERHFRTIFTAMSAFFLVLGIVAEWFGATGAVVPLLFILSALLGGWQIAIKGFKAARHLSLEMNFLMTAACIGAMVIGKWTEGAAIVLLFSLSQVLESYSMERTRRAIQSLMDISPAIATVLRDGFEFALPVEEIAVGEHLVVRPGERIALDGKVLDGESTVNQSPITGESLPIAKQKGDAVFAGSLNERGHLEIAVTHRYYDTTLARIVKAVEEAQAERAPVQSYVERISRYYSPAVFILAVIISIVPVLLFGGEIMIWLYRGLVLLVIACPCALVISTPVTIVSGLANAARRGVLIKGGRHLEAIAGLRAIAFDKTGTLTEGNPRVTGIIPLNSLSEQQVLSLSASVELKSGHHLATAILERAAKDGIIPEQRSPDEFEMIAGRGVRGTIGGKLFIIGNHEYVEELGICSPDVERTLQALENDGKTTAILCSEREPLGIIAIEDTIREESRTVVYNLHRSGIEKVVLLTGDNAASAAAIARQTGIDEFHAGILPNDKVREVKALKEKYGTVAMIGDGINDAPALAASTVSIAMGKKGDDIALETADIVLMSDDLSQLPHTIALGKKTMSVIRENIAFAIALKLVFFALGIFGMTSLWLAVFVDDGATLIVILNSLRVLWYGNHKTR
jgi:Zn2+/Cd2+-exporting ATPase